MTSTDTNPMPDIANLPDNVELLKQMVVQLATELQREQAAHRQLRQNFDLLLKRFWGPKSEKAAPGQLALFEKALAESDLANLALPLVAPPPVAASEPAKPDTESPKSSCKSPHGRRRCPDHLSRTVVTHDLTDAEKALLGGADALQQLPDQVTTQYEWNPSSLSIIEHRQNPLHRDRLELIERWFQPIGKYPLLPRKWSLRSLCMLARKHRKSHHRNRLKPL
jgi:hypothetical protein